MRNSTGEGGEVAQNQGRLSREHGVFWSRGRRGGEKEGRGDDLFYR